MTSPLTIEDIYYDLEGTAKVAQTFGRFARERTPEDIEERVAEEGRKHDTFSGNAYLTSGWTLIAACGGDTQRRYRTLLFLEKSFPVDGDFGFLIAPACQIIESEVSRLLVEPARALGDELLAPLRKGKNEKQAAILEKWLRKDFPTTMGICSIVMLALRRGCEQQSAPVATFLGANFHDGFVAQLQNKLGATLDRVREKFRNPACHGTTTFDPEGYLSFVRLAVRAPDFRSWHARGSEERPDMSEGGVLHLHLSESRVIDSAIEEGRRKLLEGLRQQPQQKRWWRFWRR